MEHKTRVETQRDERWSSQQVVRQRRSTDRSFEHTPSRETPNFTKGQLLKNYPVYHRLSTFVIAANTAVVALLCLNQHLLDKIHTCLQAFATNLLITVLIRQEHTVNLLYCIFGLIPHSMPLRIRCQLESLYHLGGIHSGTAISAALWLVILNVAVVRSDATNTSKNACATLTICLAGPLDLLLLQMLFSPCQCSEINITIRGNAVIDGQGGCCFWFSGCI